MANVAKTHLYDKDIKNLVPREKRYFKVVGDPKELCVFINPKGTKKFALRLNVDGKEVLYGLKEFREGIYSVAKARKEALQKALLVEFECKKSVNLALPLSLYARMEHYLNKNQLEFTKEFTPQTALLEVKVSEKEQETLFEFAKRLGVGV